MKKQKYKRKKQIQRWMLVLFLIGFFHIGSKFIGSIFWNIIIPAWEEKDLSEWHGDSTASDTIETLKQLSENEPRLQEIIDAPSDYPQELLEMLAKDLDLLDFVLAYPSKKGQHFSDTVGKVKSGEIPLLLQWDQRWGYANYGENNIAISGCAPTSLAMVVVGLTGNVSITPYVIATYAEANGYYTANVGTSWSLMTKGSSSFGVKGKELSLTKENVFQTLEKGYPIICSMRPGDFTSVGHFIVLTGIKNGKIQVNDPNSRKRSEKLWDYDTIESQIKNLWYFRKG